MLTVTGIVLMGFSISLWISNRWVLASVALLASIWTFWFKSKFLSEPAAGSHTSDRMNAMFLDDLVGYRKYIRRRHNIR